MRAEYSRDGMDASGHEKNNVFLTTCVIGVDSRHFYYLFDDRGKATHYTP